MESLETPRNWASRAARSHLQLSAPGRPNSSRFPAAVELTDLGALSDVLVGRRTWTSPLAQDGRDEMLGNLVQAEKSYKLWQENAAAQVLQAFQDVKRAEQKLYGEYSFFTWQETHA